MDPRTGENTYELFTGKDLEIAQLIQRRRIQLLIHSYLYYELDTNLIPDSTWNEWAVELVKLQNDYPEIADKVIYSEQFSGWDGASGAFFIYDGPTIDRARSLLKKEANENMTEIEEANKSMIELVGTICFDNVNINVYNSLYDPVFRAIDITNATGIPQEEFSKVFDLCEKDEILYLPKTIDDNSFSHIYMSESGLYDVLSQSRSPIARKWRRIIIKELIKLRKERGYNIIEQFDDWDHRLDDIYFDEETGELMETCLTEGGDTYQTVYGEDTDI